MNPLECQRSRFDKVARSIRSSADLYACSLDRKARVRTSVVSRVQIYSWSVYALSTIEIRSGRVIPSDQRVHKIYLIDRRGSHAVRAMCCALRWRMILSPRASIGPDSRYHNPPSVRVAGPCARRSAAVMMHLEIDSEPSLMKIRLCLYVV